MYLFDQGDLQKDNKKHCVIKFKPIIIKIADQMKIHKIFPWEKLEHAFTSDGTKTTIR